VMMSPAAAVAPPAVVSVTPRIATTSIDLIARTYRLR